LKFFRIFLLQFYYKIAQSNKEDYRQQ